MDKVNIFYIQNQAYEAKNLAVVQTKKCNAACKFGTVSDLFIGVIKASRTKCLTYKSGCGKETWPAGKFFMLRLF
jgi:hypothetical protein